jgi:transcriptional regulator with XRE-family HTH domain
MVIGGINLKNTYELFSLIGKNMKAIRKNIIGKSQEKMAEDIDMSRSFISHIESPNIDVGISLDTLFFLAQKYNFDIRDFFDGYETLMNENNDTKTEKEKSYQ